MSRRLPATLPLHLDADMARYLSDVLASEVSRDAGARELVAELDQIADALEAKDADRDDADERVNDVIGKHLNIMTGRARG